MDTNLTITIVILIIGILSAIYLANKRNYRERQLNKYDQYKEELNKKTIPKEEVEEEDEGGLLNILNSDLPEGKGVSLTQAIGQIVGLMMGLFVFSEVIDAIGDTMSSINTTGTNDLMIGQAVSMMGTLLPILGLIGIFTILRGVVASMSNSESKMTEYREKSLNKHDKFKNAMNTKTLRRKKNKEE